MNIGFPELLMLVLIGLLVFGPEKLPEIMRNLGRAWRSLQVESQRAASVLRDAIDEKPPEPKSGVVDRADEPQRVREEQLPVVREWEDT